MVLFRGLWFRSTQILDAANLIEFSEHLLTVHFVTNGVGIFCIEEFLTCRAGWHFDVDAILRKVVGHLILQLGDGAFQVNGLVKAFFIGMLKPLT